MKTVPATDNVVGMLMIRMPFVIRKGNVRK